MLTDQASTTRTSISIDAELRDGARKRMKALKYRKFSQYVAALIEKDVREGGDHVTVRRAKSAN